LLLDDYRRQWPRSDKGEVDHDDDDDNNESSELVRRL